MLTYDNDGGASMTIDKQETPSSTRTSNVGPRRQFSLLHLILLISWIGVMLGLIRMAMEYPFGPMPLLALGACTISFFGYAYWWTGKVAAGLAMGALPVLGSCFFLPSIRYTPTGARPRMQCSSQLHNLSLALQNYHGIHGTFPPAYIADDTGKPIHSWRVLILPFMEQQALYDAYSFDEPWDGPNNRKLHSTVIEVLRCPHDEDADDTETSYVAVTGPGTMWPGTTATTWKAATDGTSSTILLVECASSGIHWMEPRDLHINAMPMAVDPSRGCGCGSRHGDGANVAFVDGSVHWLPDSMSPETLRLWLECADGQTASIP